MKRGKNDRIDDEAICEAALRPGMRFVPVKLAETQAKAMVLSVRELLVKQQTQAINALRGHAIASYGVFRSSDRPITIFLRALFTLRRRASSGR